MSEEKFRVAGIILVMENPESTTDKPRAFTREYLSELSTISIEVKTDLHPILNAVNERLGTTMEAREGGQHISVISPTESKVLASLTDEQIDELRDISFSLKTGEGVEVTGIGYIDGASHPNLREVDQQKRTCFVALSIPALQNFRTALGLPEKDFHVTLGFENGDIHSEIDTQSENGKKVMVPIGKKANSGFSELELPELQFSQLSGKQKQKKQA
jgi:hypothetical protein